MRAYAFAAVYARTSVTRALSLGEIDGAEACAHLAPLTFWICMRESRDVTYIPRAMTYFQNCNVTVFPPHFTEVITCRILKYRAVFNVFSSLVRIVLLSSATEREAPFDRVLDLFFLGLGGGGGGIPLERLAILFYCILDFLREKQE